MGRRLVYDCETDGLLPVLTKIHCLVIRDLDTEEVFSFADHRQTSAYPDIPKGLEMLHAAEESTAHNGYEFDHRAILKCYPSFGFTGKHIDSMIVSRAFFSNIKEEDFKKYRRGQFPAHLLMKNHSLEAWGYRLGIRKGDFDGPWDNWTQEMHDYCIQDVRVLVGLCKLIETKKLPAMAVETELEVGQYLAEQHVNGFKLDVPGAVKLYSFLKPKQLALEEPLKERFKFWYAADSKGVKVPKKTIRYRREHLDEDVRETFVAGAPFVPIKKVLFNPGSRDHIAHVLQKQYGWQPQEFTDSGKPEVSDDIVASLPYPEAPMITEFLLLSKRIGALAEGKQAWMKLADKDGFIHGNVNQSGCPTHRASHSNPNMTQVPSVDAPYGKECRSLFIAPPGWKLMGSDLSGAQLRCLAHYMARYDGGAYVDVILNGDVHTTNLTAGKPYLTTRPMAKTFIYAFLFGAGNWKIGHTCRPLMSEEEKVRIGMALKKTFLTNLPALGNLVAAVEQAFEKKKCLTLLDGHTVYIKQKHTALNYLLQGTEAIIAKRWIFHLRRALKRDGLKSGWSGDYAANVFAHDELQISVRDVDGLPQHVGQTAIDLIPMIGEELKFRCPLAGEFKLGANWADTH